MEISEKDETRFWSKVNIPHGGFGCWEWTSGKNGQGYGQFYLSSFPGRCVSAHRIAWILSLGKIPAGVLALHHCDNPACVNPAHLFLGTHADNAHDRDQKGRRLPPAGALNGNAKLTEADIQTIRDWDNSGVPRAEIARRLGVSPPLISRVMLGKAWKHVP